MKTRYVGQSLPPGSIVELEDGRICTVVEHSLVGYGVRYGRHSMPDYIKENLLSCSKTSLTDREVQEWSPEAVAMVGDCSFATTMSEIKWVIA